MCVGGVGCGGAPGKGRQGLWAGPGHRRDAGTTCATGMPAANRAARLRLTSGPCRELHCKSRACPPTVPLGCETCCAASGCGCACPPPKQAQATSVPTCSNSGCCSSRASSVVMPVAFVAPGSMLFSADKRTRRASEAPVASCSAATSTMLLRALSMPAGGPSAPGSVRVGCRSRQRCAGRRPCRSGVTTGGWAAHTQAGACALRAAWRALGVRRGVAGAHAARLLTAGLKIKHHGDGTSQGRHVWPHKRPLALLRICQRPLRHARQLCRGRRCRPSCRQGRGRCWLCTWQFACARWAWNSWRCKRGRTGCSLLLLGTIQTGRAECCLRITTS